MTATSGDPDHSGPSPPPLRPLLRGWLHAGTFPVALTAGVVLSILAPEGRARTGVIVFSVTATLLFGTSALYHRFAWSERIHLLLKRFDHANIFLIIAGSYTPFALCLLPTDQARTLLITVWSGAAAGVVFKMVWPTAPRWLSTPIYVALGWVAVFYFPPLLHSGGPAVMSLIVAGGILYTVGAVVYGTKRPDPAPRWFGFHEVFHACTVAAFVLHSVAVSVISLTGSVVATIPG